MMENDTEIVLMLIRFGWDKHLEKKTGGDYTHVVLSFGIDGEKHSFKSQCFP